MIPPSLRPPLEAFSERLRGVFGARLREVRLFGSYARGEAHEDSDVDVLVVIDDYERTWDATPDVSAAAFAEIVPIIDRAVSHLASTGWSPPSM